MKPSMSKMKADQMMRDRFAKATGIPSMMPPERGEKKKESKRVESGEPKRKR